MSIYDKPTKLLMTQWVSENLQKGLYFNKQQVIDWFKARYPKIKSNTVAMHIEGMSVNNTVRRHHPIIKPGAGYDLFYKEGPGRFRLWVPESDPPPRYKSDIEAENASMGGHSQMIANPDEGEYEADSTGNDTFAYEKDLQNYLVKNLHVLENGLSLYEEEGLTGVEYYAGGQRRIDILARDKSGALVVIELKVSRGYDRVIGQLLRYMGWVQQNLAEDQPVRGMIVAGEITEDLVLATSHIAGKVELYEYRLAFNINKKAC